MTYKEFEYRKKYCCKGDYVFVGYDKFKTLEEWCNLQSGGKMKKFNFVVYSKYDCDDVSAVITTSIYFLKYLLTAIDGLDGWGSWRLFCLEYHNYLEQEAMKAPETSGPKLEF